MKLYLIIVVCAFILFSSCTAQTSSNKGESETKITEETISNLGSSIMMIYQDSKDNYWFASWETGIYKYDGKSLINYTTKDGLANNRIDDIQEDSLGNMYFTSCHPHSSITKFDGNSFSMLEVAETNDWQLNPNDLWFKYSYGNEKVYRYDGTTLHELLLPKPPNLSNPYEVYSIYKDSKGNVWFGTNPVGACRYNGASFDWITEEDVTEFRDEGANGVRSILEDKNGDFWFNTEYRYSIYDSSTIHSGNFYTRHKSIGGLDGKEDSDLDEYLSAIIDNENNLWFVTYLDGVWKYDGTEITHYQVQVDSQNIALFNIYKDNKGDLWLGSQQNGAYKLKDNTFEKFIIK